MARFLQKRLGGRLEWLRLKVETRQISTTFTTTSMLLLYDHGVGQEAERAAVSSRLHICAGIVYQPRNGLSDRALLCASLSRHIEAISSIFMLHFAASLQRPRSLSA